MPLVSQFDVKLAPSYFEKLVRVVTSRISNPTGAVGREQLVECSKYWLMVDAVVEDV